MEGVDKLFSNTDDNTLTYSSLSENPTFANAKKERKIKRAFATKRVEQLSTLLNNDSPDVPDVTVQLNTLTEIRNRLYSLDEIIQQTLDDDSCLTDYEESVRRREIIDKIILKAQQFLHKDKHSINSCSHSQHSTCSGSPAGFKLPQLKLPTFEGDILEFRAFWDQFSAAVDNKDLDDVVKLQLLLNCLKGSIKKSVSGYRLDAKSYSLVVEYLKKLFLNPPKVIETLIMRLVKLPTPTYTYTGLHSFKGEIQF